MLPTNMMRKWLRVTRTFRAHLQGEAAQLRAEAVGSGAKEEIMERLDGGHLDSTNGGEAWKYLLCFLAEQHFGGCVELLHMMTLSFGERVYIPPQLSMSVFDLAPKIETQASVQKTSVAVAVDLDTDEEEALTRRKVAKLIVRGDWLDRVVGWDVQALGDYSQAILLLGTPVQLSSNEASAESSATAAHAVLSSSPVALSQAWKAAEELRRKALWKRHKIFLRRGNPELAMNDLESCIACLDAMAARQRAGQMLGRSADTDEGRKAQHRLAKSWYSRGVVMYKQRRHDEAEKCFLEAAKNEGRAAAARGYLGLIYSYRGPGHRPLAIKMLRQVSPTCPSP